MATSCSLILRKPCGVARTELLTVRGAVSNKPCNVNSMYTRLESDYRGKTLTGRVYFRNSDKGGANCIYEKSCGVTLKHMWLYMGKVCFT